MIRFDDILEKVSATYNEKDVTLLQKAYVFAAKAHKGQVRLSGEPYLSHPLEVTSMLADMHLDKITLAAGLLHDVLEDTEVTPVEIKEVFGKEIAGLVEGVTKISRVHNSSPEVSQAETIRKIILAMTDDLRVIFIKLADRIHNLKTLTYLSEDKQRQVAKETLDIYAPIANRLGMGRIRAELEDLSFRYVAPADYAQIESLVEPQKQKVEKALKQFKKTLESLMKENGIPAEIFYRIKRSYSICDKMKRQKIEFNQVYDFLALRIITDSVKNCYAALGIIHQKWPHIPHRFRDFIAMPKPNLYQALHTTILTEEKQTFEIQIRTKEMHNLAENGIAAHWKYKDTDPQSIIKEDKRLQWLREMAELYREQKSSREFLKHLKTNLIPEEVYVFTPKGKVISLPPRASALDFAFKIHSEIGMHATGAKINNRLSPLKSVLRTGDIVEILTAPDKIPSPNWLNMVQTSDARHYIKRWLNLKSKAKSVALGKKLWEKELGKYRLSSELLKEEDLLKRVSEIKNLKIPTMEDFYYQIGLAKIALDKAFMEKVPVSGKIELKKETLIDRLVLAVTPKSKKKVQLREAGEQLVQLAKCCSPIRGEPIIGYISSGKGITVHSLRCAYVTKEILDPERMVDVSWDEFQEPVFKGRLLVEAMDSLGVLAKVATVIAQLEGNIKKADVNTFADKKAQIKLTLAIEDINHLEAIIKKLSGIKEIFSAKRI